MYAAGGDPLPGGCGEDPGRALHPTDGGHLQNSHRKAKKIRKDYLINEKIEKILYKRDCKTKHVSDSYPALSRLRMAIL